MQLRTPKCFASICTWPSVHHCAHVHDYPLVIHGLDCLRSYGTSIRPQRSSWHGACRYLLATPTKVLRDELAAKIGQAGLQRGQDKDHCDLLYAQTTEMLEEQHPDLLRNIEDLEATLETRSLNELPTLYYHRYRFCVRIPCSSDRATSMCEAVLFDQIPKCCPIVRKNTTRQDVAAVMASHAGLASPSVLPIVLPDSLLLR